MKKKTTPPKFQIPKISVAISVEEVCALMMMLTVGKRFTPPKYREQVKTVFKRIGKSLIRRGLKQATVDQLLAKL
jgi:hypothetical protein